jgi:hypothetical protein
LNVSDTQQQSLLYLPWPPWATLTCRNDPDCQDKQRLVYTTAIIALSECILKHRKNIFYVKKSQLRAISGIVQTPLKEGGCRDISNIFADKLRLCTQSL